MAGRNLPLFQQNPNKSRRAIKRHPRIVIGADNRRFYAIVVRENFSCVARGLTHTPLFWRETFLSGIESQRERRIRVQSGLKWDGRKPVNLNPIMKDFLGNLKPGSQIPEQG